MSHVCKSEGNFLESVLLPLQGFWGLNSGCQAFMASVLPPPSHLLGKRSVTYIDLAGLM